MLSGGLPEGSYYAQAGLAAQIAKVEEIIQLFLPGFGGQIAACFYSTVDVYVKGPSIGVAGNSFYDLRFNECLQISRWYTYSAFIYIYGFLKKEDFVQGIKPGKVELFTLGVVLILPPFLQ